MTKPTIAPYGEWDSPFPISLLTAGIVTLGEVRASDGVRWWLEGRSDEKGRQVLVRRNVDGSETRLTPEGLNARTRVHEYGGGAYVVDDDLVVVSDFDTGRLNRVDTAGELTPLTPERAWRFADLVVDRPRNRLLAIREDHELETLERHGEAENSLVSIDLDGGELTVLVSGRRLHRCAPPVAGRRSARVARVVAPEPAVGRDGAAAGRRRRRRIRRRGRPRSPAARPTGSPSRAGRRTGSSISSPSRTAG